MQPANKAHTGDLYFHSPLTSIPEQFHNAVLAVSSMGVICILLIADLAQRVPLPMAQRL